MSLYYNICGPFEVTRLHTAMKILSEIDDLVIKVYESGDSGRTVEETDVNGNYGSYFVLELQSE